ncbi:hypothetical protein [Mammaliicoccus sp. E-M21]|uniref:hypothetical protein n=1 Tax=Mammaliicoccus sp. E-M21 TaxID=2898681 RepID=UPI001EFB16FB|nr:hypothetical protein [Mammaliicoccus sp. E-M21]
MSEEFKKKLVQQYFRTRVIDIIESVKSSCYNIKTNIISAESTLSNDELYNQLKNGFYTNKKLGSLRISHSFELDSDNIPNLSEDELDIMIKNVIEEFDFEKTLDEIEGNIGGDFW